MERARIRVSRSATALGTLLLAVAALVLAVLAARFGPAASVAEPAAPVAESAAGSDPQPPDVVALPPDVVALGTEVTPLDPDGMIPLDQALSVARREYPGVFQQGHIEAYLVELTDPSQLGGLQDRPIWIVKATGLSLDVFSDPMGPDGTPSDVGKAHLAYIYVDAVTGTWLSAGFFE